MTRILENTRFCESRRRAQSGVALLQVLLISTVISLLALSLTFSARDQVDIALQFENRVKAQLKAESAINIALFVQLSESAVSFDPLGVVDFTHLKGLHNLYGDLQQWDENTAVVAQDMNGLLPQIYPSHFLWDYLLLSLSFGDVEVRELMGVWSDAIDKDSESWLRGDREPVSLPNGKLIENDFPQTDHLVSWVFFEYPKIIESIKSTSHVLGSYDINLLNAPEFLIRKLFDPSIAEQILAIRKAGNVMDADLNAILPNGFLAEEIYIHDSATRKISATSSHGGARITISKIFYLNPQSEPPFSVILVE
ncbi:MAG: hypothetical protein P8Q37_02965 [Porticoccaceae bacterium]|nr:hypothetical protein [Porticoccaceae bacterium]MDG1473835.1 hypothetical protein [Porticoccaceae bacterium]